jgi:tetratricopeptide (TPR) repeat protein
VSSDYLGNPIAPAEAATREAVDGFIEGFIGYTPRILEVLGAADRDPGSVLANAYAGWLWMFSESVQGLPEARRYLARAEARLAAAPPRERLTTALLARWIDGDIDGATGLAEEILVVAPRDLAALKLHQYLNFNRGRSSEMLRIALGASRVAADVAEWHGMLAFAYEQCHRLEEAEAAARRALDLRSDEPWAQHALAHVTLTEGRIEEGIDLLEAASPGWEGLTSFMYTHNWWHLAVFYLARGRYDEALRIYDEHVWARDRSYSQDQVGAVSLLVRLELADQPVGERWHGLAEYLAAREADVVEPFLSLQYAYGLARAGRPEAERLVEAIRARAGRTTDSAHATWAEVARPAAEGLVAHARGDAATCLARLGPALGRMVETGGSHAQRDLFALIHLDSLIREGALGAAQQALELRRRADPGDVGVNRQLAAIYDRLGLPSLAVAVTESAARARGS